MTAPALPVSEDCPTVVHLGGPLATPFLRLEVEMEEPGKFCLAIVDHDRTPDDIRLPADRAAWILADAARWILVDGQAACDWFREACFRSDAAVRAQQQPIAAE